MPQKKASRHLRDMQRETVKGREQEQSSSWKKELHTIQMDESSGGPVLPCPPALANPPATNKPLECLSLPAQSSPLIWKTMGGKTPAGATGPLPEGRPPVKSRKPSQKATKPKPAPLMEKAKKMMSFLRERHLNKSLKFNRRSQVPTAQGQQLGTSFALPTWEPNFQQPQPSRTPQETSASLRQGAQRARENEDSLTGCAHRNTQKQATFFSVPWDGVGRSIQRCPTDRATTGSSSMVKTTDQSPRGPAPPCQPATKRPVKDVSLPSQASQCKRKTKRKMRPEETPCPPPVGKSPAKSTRGATKCKSTPLMRKAKKMRTFLQERHLDKSLMKGLPERSSTALPSLEPKPYQSQPSRRLAQPSQCPRQEAQQSPVVPERNAEDSRWRCLLPCRQEPPTLSSCLSRDLKKAIQRSPLDTQTHPGPVAQSTAQLPPTKRLHLSMLHEDLHLSSSSEDEEE